MNPLFFVAFGIGAACFALTGNVLWTVGITGLIVYTGWFADSEARY